MVLYMVRNNKRSFVVMFLKMISEPYVMHGIYIFKSNLIRTNVKMTLLQINLAVTDGWQF